VVGDFLILGYVLLIFASISFWESYIEGKYPWAQKQVGWKIKILNYKTITSYHFFAYIIMVPLFLGLPFIVFGFDLHTFWVFVASYFFGIVLEDFLWFVVNPYYGLKKFNSETVYWHKWIKVRRFEVPDFYVYFLTVGIFIWLFLV